MLRNMLLVLASAALVAPAVSAQAIPNDTEFRVKLIAPLSTENNREGDRVTGQVLSPPEYQGDMVEGVVKKVQSGNKIKGKSVLNFTFETLNHGGQPIPISSQVKSFSNSKGIQNTDEEGQVVQKKNNLGKVAAGTAVGAVIGGLAGGGKGAAIGAGAGAALTLVLVEVGSKGPSITFAAGSEFILSVGERRGGGMRQ